MSTSSAPFDIAIVGGGIAGLILALSLHEHAPHIPLTIYEAAPKFGEIGAGVAFGPNARRAMHLISPAVREGFERRATANKFQDKGATWFDFRCGMDIKTGRKDGEYVAESRIQGGQSDGRVHRADFLDEMVKLLPEGVAKFGKRLVEMEETDDEVVVKFADGSKARHSAVIGCDGIKSRTRAWMHGESNPISHAVFTGKYCYRGLIPMDDAVELLGEELAANSQMYMGYGGHILTFPVQKGKTMNVVAFSSAKTWDAEAWVVPADREKMYKDYEGWGKTVHDILKLMQKPDIWALFNHLPCEKYSKGRVCLIGDAAHASTPHQGAGAGMAVEDGYVMSKILASVRRPEDLAVAFEAFDYCRRERTQKLVTTSKDAGQLYDLELQGVRDNLDKAEQNLHCRMKWIWEHTLDGDVAEGRRYFIEHTPDNDEKARL